MSDYLTESRLRESLDGRPFRFFPQVGSTSDLAREWAAIDAPNGALVIAEEQIAGRGRFDRRWHAPPGSALLFSVIVRLPPSLAPYLSRLSIAGSLAVLYAVESLDGFDAESESHPIALKWPNDVLLNGRKLAGILTESDWDGARLRSAIIGIGVNVRVPFDTLDGLADVPLSERAVSLEPAIGHPIDRIALLAAILDKLSFWTARLADPSLMSTWRSRLVTLGTHVTVRSMVDDRASDTPISGLAVDVDNDGALLVQDDHGQIHRYIAGDVSLR